ncbi:MAG: universal stress protein [Thermodesulfobacteriota bacterium]|nr:universal stress protein [Thermodesulfobacteriota bacterium]
MEKKSVNILLACDGSELSLDAVRYIGKTFAPEYTRVVLFYVDSKIPRSFWNMEKQMDFRFQPSHIRASMTSQCKLVNEFMAKAQNLLLNAGFSEEFVVKKIHTKKQGVVRDIAYESLQGYDAVVVGRKGHSRIKDILFGSVPERLLGKIRRIPLIIVGGVPVHNNILVAFDGTRAVKKAVRCLSFMGTSSESKFLLCHAVAPHGVFHRDGDELSSEAKREKIDSMLNESKEYLSEAGFSFSQVSCEVMEVQKQLSGDMIEKARQGNYGTIVIGRRDLGFFKKFFIGRVGAKIFNLADNLIIWVVQ